ncbi:MAG TPA: amidohydrolase family protein [Verrucomicrobiae bacterium]|jgi:L-fuconolactonase|nr:amidohydrolase family protein [Verrucomicrobiae bacterium]
MTTNAPPIVDTHVHLWDPTRLRYSWLDGVASLNRPFLPADFAAASANANVIKIIFVEASCEPNQGLAEVDWVSGLAKTESRLRGIVAHASLENGLAVESELAALATRPLVKGVRRLLQGETDPNFLRQPKFVAGVKLLAKFGFTFDLCIRQHQLRAATQLVRTTPEVNFVLDHFGKPDVRGKQTEPWATELKELAALPNVICKLSGLTTEADLEHWQSDDLKFYFARTLEFFGYERVLFGSDWPVSTLATTYQRWVETVREMVSSASLADQAKLFHANAERIYRI